MDWIGLEKGEWNLENCRKKKRFSEIMRQSRGNRGTKREVGTRAVKEGKKESRENRTEDRG